MRLNFIRSIRQPSIVTSELTAGQIARVESAESASPRIRAPESASVDHHGVPPSLGIVVIGRNEGDRLKRCLESLRGLANRTVYVDSGSTDDSLAMSRGLGVSVLELDSQVSFTAARARNEGFRKLLESHPSLEYVFFVDGDCEVASGWLETATQFLDQHPEAAVVAGRRRERYPGHSVYNLLCDLEWDSFPMGDTAFCGGDALMRVGAFTQVHGFRSGLICGEEPELCVRLRAAGWHIWRIDREMTLHDAALYRFSQWWRRMVRGGYAYAQGAYLHGRSPARHWVSESRRAWIWGLWIPLFFLGLTVAFGPAALLLLLVYPLQVLRLASEGSRSASQNWLRAGALVLSKFPETAGQLKFTWDRIRGKRSQLIEYK